MNHFVNLIKLKNFILRANKEISRAKMGVVGGALSSGRMMTAVILLFSFHRFPFPRFPLNAKVLHLSTMLTMRRH